MLWPEKYCCENSPLFRALPVLRVFIPASLKLHQLRFLPGGMHQGSQIDRGVRKNVQLEFGERGGVQGVDKEGGRAGGMLKNIYSRVANSSAEQSE